MEEMSRDRVEQGRPVSLCRSSRWKSTEGFKEGEIGLILNKREIILSELCGGGVARRQTGD